MSSWLPDVKPEWWSTVKAFATGPGEFIKSHIRTFLVSGVIAAIEAFTGRIRWLWSIVADAVGAFGDAVDVAFTSGGDVLLDAVGIFPELLRSFATDLGPIVGPIVVGVGGALLIWAVWQGLKRAPGAAWAVYQALPLT